MWHSSCKGKIRIQLNKCICIICTQSPRFFLNLISLRVISRIQLEFFFASTHLLNIIKLTANDDTPNLHYYGIFDKQIINKSFSNLTRGFDV